MEKIKKSSIEVKKCNDKVNYKDDFGQRFEDTEKREKERQKQEKEQQKREKERQKRERQDARQNAKQNAKQNKYQPPPPRPSVSSYRKNCEDIFLRERIIDEKLPLNITKDIKDSINSKWKKWTLSNHPDKKTHLSEEEQIKYTQLFQSVTECKEKVMKDDLYDERGQGCNVM
jgi:hypothetical protein